MEKNKMIQTTLVGLEGTLKNKRHALDITISNLVKYRPDEAGESRSSKYALGITAFESTEEKAGE